MHVLLYFFLSAGAIVLIGYSILYRPPRFIAIVGLIAFIIVFTMLVGYLVIWMGCQGHETNLCNQLEGWI